ncbi:hypothetical protein [Xenorhabdus lircayensis]|uniref:Glycosyltransferase n=1 Tax=Xenorhabdus lircayensis TaxID=2763499 RepID=A0ABS0U5J3_9GAMM|nr:hypothetical protein [Xenorhabdus lircayensis]MBI6548025.1 hypothetical protein [Xenorhabdus lircayensis]
MNENSFLNKKIAIFCPKFFGYDKKIVQQLESLGAKVKLYDDKPSNNTLFKIIIRLRLHYFVNSTIQKYYDNILYELKKSPPDHILFMNPETLKSEIIKKFKDSLNKTKFIVYMWDSILNRKNATSYIDKVDSFFSFDHKDAKELRIDFLPLFYSNDYSIRNHRQKSKEIYDICFIGTAHSERHLLLNKVIRTINSKDIFKFLYCPNVLVFFVKKYLTRELKGLKINDISFVPMKTEDILNAIHISKCVLDVPHLAQNGLTIRTIEMLGAGKKIITTNKEICNYDFYNKNNIYILTEDNFSGINDFISSEYQPLPIELYEKYSLQSWLKIVFS